MQFELVSDQRLMQAAYERLLYTDHLLVDLGAKNRMNKFLAQYRNKPILARYYATDIQQGNLHFISDVQAVPLASGSVDAVICNAVIEHVHEPWTLASEIYRILRVGGLAYVYAPFLFPYHAENRPDAEKAGGYDCYRFTLDGLRYLFRDFSLMRASPVQYGIAFWWRMAVFYRFHWTYRHVDRVQKLIEKRVGRPLGVYQASGYDLWLEK